MVVLKSFNDLVQAIMSLGIPNWLDIVTVAISGLSLLLAIFVPFRIAKNQNRIALFEKRMEAYKELERTLEFAKSVSSQNALSPNSGLDSQINKVSFINLFSSVFEVPSELTDIEKQLDYVLTFLRKEEAKVSSLSFLYGKQTSNKIEGITCAIDSLFKCLHEYTTAIKSACLTTDWSSIQNKLKQSTKPFNKYLDAIRRELEF